MTKADGDRVSANKALQPTANPLRGLSTAELSRQADEGACVTSY